MGTKANPGRYDCYARAEPDEPLFVLRAHDPDAPLLVRLWASIRARSREDPEVVAEALQCANDMEAWRAGERAAVPPPAPRTFDACATCGHARTSHDCGSGICTAVLPTRQMCQCDSFTEPS